MRRSVSPLTLRNARVWEDGGLRLVDLRLAGGRVLGAEPPGAWDRGDRELDLEGRVVIPGLVNAHDHLDFSTFPSLGCPPYASVYEWAAAVDAGGEDPAVKAALAVPLSDRLFLGGIRNLLAGVTAVAHHNPFHRSLGRSDFPVRVLTKYGFAHSPGLTPNLRRTYRTTDRRIPWMVHAAEGTDERCQRELEDLGRANVLRQNTVIIHGIALRPEDAPRIAAARACVVWCPESNRHLYGATAPVGSWRGAGVRLGLGSDSPVSGVRDPLSNLAAARREGVFADAELLRLATRESAEVARLPVGGFGRGDPADLVVVGSLDGLLAGDRTAVGLVVVAGRPVYGEPALMEPLTERSVIVDVEGAKRRIDDQMGRRAGAISKAHPAIGRVPWLASVRWF